MKRINNLKKTLALFLALVMSLSLCITAFAASTDDMWSSVTMGGITISVSTGTEHLEISGSGTSYAITSTISNYFPQNFSLMISDTSVDVTATNGASFGFYNGTYGLVTMGTAAATLTVKNGETLICTISCPAPINNGGTSEDTGVYAFLPAPGQFTNSGVTNGGWGSIYNQDGTLKNMRGTVATTGVSLGYFGGYVVFDMGEEGIKNDPAHPYGVDFIVYGNAFWGNSEPGCIQVSKDKQTWYDIAGSLYYNEETTRNTSVRYEAPSDLTKAADVDYYIPSSSETKKTITTNPFHPQSWFPLYENYFADRLEKPGIAKVNELSSFVEVQNTYSTLIFKNSVLLGGITATNDTAGLGFGYCDVHPNNSGNVSVAYNPYQTFTSANDFTSKTTGTGGGDPIDLAWAVDENGNPAGFTSNDVIRYVRIYTGPASVNPMLGEISTEVCGIAKVTGTTTETTVDMLTALESGAVDILFNREMGIEDTLGTLLASGDATIEESGENYAVVNAPTIGQLYADHGYIEMLPYGYDTFSINSVVGQENETMQISDVGGNGGQIRIIGQTGEAEPYILILNLGLE